MVGTDRYYDILGVKKGASVDEIKKVFRIKAKLLHPDRNKSPTANADFALLNEAYEYLLEPQKEVVYTRVKKSTSPFKSKPKTNQEKERAGFEERQAKSRAFAKRQNDEYVNSKHYHLSEALNTLTSYSGVLAVFVLPVIMIIVIGGAGLVAAVLINLILLPSTIKSFKDSSSLSFREFFSALFVLFRTKAFMGLLIGALFLTLFVIVLKNI